MRPEVDLAQVRKSLRSATKIIVLIFIGSVLLGVVRPYTEYLWFVHDARRPEVFVTAYSTRGWLFIASLLVSWLFLYFNLRKALSATLVYLNSPGSAASTGQNLISNAIPWIQDKGKSLVWYGAPVFGFFTALGFSNEWNTFLLWKHGGTFGIKDPAYGMDLGFFVFSLPWLLAVINGIFSLFVLTAALTVGIYLGLQSLASIAKIELGRPGFRLHVSFLIGVVFLLFAVQTWLKTYEVGLIDSGQFTGAGFSASQAVAASRILAILAGLTGIGTILGAKAGKPYGIPMVGGIACVTFYGLGIVVYPEIVQKFFVDPNRLSKEAPFAARAIRMTRFAYGLDKVETRDFAVSSTPSRAEIAEASPTLDNMRLWDPDVLRQSLLRLQAVRPYYTFPDVDIDRYQIHGKQTMVMLSGREIDLGGLDSEARNWTNERLRYTHGYGLTISQVNAATTDGQPVFLNSDIPQKSEGTIPISEPRIYFGNQRNAQGDSVDEYALVDTGEPELDYQTATQSFTHKWQADRGIPIGGLLARLAFWTTLGDSNLLVSGNVRTPTRLLIHRNVLERAALIYPFLRFDRDPYLVVLKGRPTWVLDGYTLSDKVPYSARLEGAASVNYIRNSVKATIDAYSGEMKAYSVDPTDPLLKAYRAIYPGLVEDLSALPPGLAEHFRYPEDLLGLQCTQMMTYHVVDPVSFLSNADAWDIAAERDLSGTKAPIKPYYVEMKLPDEPQPGFVQILPFTPRGRQNMSGWLAAHCDPGRYGKLVLYRFATGVPISGPELMEGNFTSTPEISNINRQYNNDQSEIVVGNLLVIPVGHSVMYAEPLYLRSKATGIQAAPRLIRVILAVGDRIVVGESYEEALRKLFGTEGASAVPAAQSTIKSEGTQLSLKAQVAQAIDLYNRSQAALKAGDFAKYGLLQRGLKARLDQLGKQKLP